MKILNLTKAEILKQTKKLSFKVCLIILLVLAIGLPILFKVFTPNTSTQVEEEVKANIEAYNENIVANPKTTMEKLTNELNKISINTENLKLKNKSINSENDYRNDLYEQYRIAKSEYIVLSYALDNKKMDYNLLDEQFDLNTTNYKDFNKEEISVTMENLKKHYTTLKQTIDNNNYKDHLQEEINYLKTQEQDEKTKQIISLYNKLLKLNITDPSDIRIKYAEDVVNSINSKEKVLSKAEYSKTSNQTSYDNYVKITKKTNEDFDKKIKKSLYAIDHNIDHNKTGSRT